MGRNQPFDFSDDEDLTIASGGANTADAEYSETGWSDSPNMNSAMDDIGGQASEKATQKSQTATHARSSAEQHDTPTSMNRKRGNQPR
jgi:hypothetical protein